MEPITMCSCIKRLNSADWGFRYYNSVTGIVLLLTHPTRHYYATCALGRIARPSYGHDNGKPV